MSFDLRWARWPLAFALVISVLGASVERAHAASAWVESDGACKVESLDARPNEVFAWTGRCVEGFAEGPGVLSRSVDGQLKWTFRGLMKAGRQMGEGRLEFANGDVYEGSFVDGRRTGLGSYVTPDSRYDGDFVDDAFTGRGRIVMRSMLEYEGELLAGRWEGQGVMHWYTGEVLTGLWKGGVAQRGEIARSNGDTCRGEFKRGQLSGAGRCDWANGDAYEGEFFAGFMSGQGDYKFRDGRRYQGGFRRGAPSGQGMLSRDGVVVYRGAFVGGAPDSVDGLVPADGRKLPDAEAAALLAGLKFAFAPAVLVPLTPLSGQKVCTKMGTPVMPKVETAWRGEALFKVVATVRDGSVVMTEMTPLTSGVDRVAQRAIMQSIDATMRDTYECPGNHVFEMQFSFKL